MKFVSFKLTSARGSQPSQRSWPVLFSSYFCFPKTPL